MDDRHFDELAEWIAIPSVSADVQHWPDVRRAGEWLCDRVRAAGGTAELVEIEAAGNTHPIAVGEVAASSGADSAPTVLLYGHFDVQPPDPLELWSSPPFEASRNGEWLVGRGVADDKGQLYLLLKAVEELARDGALPVNVRFACDGEEETGGHSIVEYLAADERGADAAVIFDSDMLARGRPAFAVATRGLCYLHVRVTTGSRDLHSGIFGGAALNAMHALVQILDAVRARDGRLPEPLRAGLVPPTREEVEGWRALPPGDQELATQGARPMDEHAAEEFYLRTFAEPAVDVNGIEGGSPQLQKTVIPVEAVANVSIRLAPGQDPLVIARVLEDMLRHAAPEGADVEVDLWAWSAPGLVDPDAAAIRLGQAAFERVLGMRPVLVRSGGTLPIIPALAQKGIPVVVTGFALPDSNIHSPNERILLDYVPLGISAAKELLTAYAALRSA